MMKANKFIQECKEQRRGLRIELKKAVRSLDLMKEIQTKIKNLKNVIDHLNEIINSVKEPK